MIYNIANRVKRITPLNDTEFKIIRSATKLFLENGFSKTTVSMISKDCNVAKGNIVYYFHTKEDMLFLLIQELMDYHKTVMIETEKESHDKVFACAMEITTQISLCEYNPTARDLYYSAYSHPGIFEYIKDWAAKKNYKLFNDVLPDWTEEKFRIMENVASHIEFSALTSPCSENFTLEDKIKLVIDSYMRLYDISHDERNTIIEKVLATDYKNIGEKVFDKFLEKFYKSINENEE